MHVAHLELAREVLACTRGSAGKPEQAGEECLTHLHQGGLRVQAHGTAPAQTWTLLTCSPVQSSLHHLCTAHAHHPSHLSR